MPMLKGDDLLGVIAIYRLEVRPFDDQQIALVETFADQAVIAIENTRLFEAEQRASEEFFRSSSSRPPPLRCSRSSAARPSILQDCVLRRIGVKSARHGYATLIIPGCSNARGTVFTGSRAFGNAKDAHNAIGIVKTRPVPLGSRQSGWNRARGQGDSRSRCAGGPGLYLEWSTGDRQVPAALASLCLLRKGCGGHDICSRKTVCRSPLLQNSVELVTTFADQAVIAIENTRLLDELVNRLSSGPPTSEGVARHLELARYSRTHFRRNAFRSPFGYARLSVSSLLREWWISAREDCTAPRPRMPKLCNRKPWPHQRDLLMVLRRRSAWFTSPT